MFQFFTSQTVRFWKADVWDFGKFWSLKGPSDGSKPAVRMPQSWSSLCRNLREAHNHVSLVSMNFHPLNMNLTSLMMRGSSPQDSWPPNPSMEPETSQTAKDWPKCPAAWPATVKQHFCSTKRTLKQLTCLHVFFFTIFYCTLHCHCLKQFDIRQIMLNMF